MYSLHYIIKILDVQNLAIRSREFCELSGRTEVNLIDVLNTLLEKNIFKDEVQSYINETKVKYRFAKQGRIKFKILAYIGKIADNEERERESLIRKINSNNVTGIFLYKLL